MVHAETSTGVRNPVEEISTLLDPDTLFLVDMVTSLGGMNVPVDEWHVDAGYSGSQKCLSCPPGLSPVTFSDKAMHAIQNRKRKVPNWYLDMNMIINYWEGEKRAYHHTAPINMLYALYQSLLLVLEEGMDTVFNRHHEAHKHLVSGLEELGVSFVVEPEFRLPMLNAVHIPAKAHDTEVRALLREKYKIEIGGGLGPLAGKTWRIGLMGHTARRENAERLLTALKEIIHH